ncbi:MAG: citrate transporter, partial [Candidatus Accumulibacter sp.]|nr:citrate transporter [Accumulibacter sp.]
MSQMVLAQILMAATLILMITGLTPLYSTAIVGSAIAALVAGFALSGGKDVISLTSLVNSGLNPVIADMTGVLLFIGVMQATGFLDVIIKTIIRLGRVLGGAPGVTTAGGIAAGIIGALTG